MFIEMAPLTKDITPEKWGLSDTRTPEGFWRVTNVSKLPRRVLYKKRDRQAVNDLRGAYRELGVDAGEFVKGTGHTASI